MSSDSHSRTVCPVTHTHVDLFPHTLEKQNEFLICLNLQHELQSLSKPLGSSQFLWKIDAVNRSVRTVGDILEDFIFFFFISSDMLILYL